MEVPLQKDFVLLFEGLGIPLKEKSEVLLALPPGTYTQGWVE
jgi:hypothetical protein